jgi:zinc protease
MTIQPGAVLKTRLRNGLEVRLKEIHTAPLISSWIWYRVGSRNERPGTTGISHWVEHMQFKGTPTFPAGVLDKAISRDGGLWNAMTWIDWTAYFETMPADKAVLGLRLEADRMVNSLYEAQEVGSERTVIISERQGHENDPTFRLTEEIQATAFRIHPYHHEVIGDMADLENMTRDDLYQHYRRYYAPSNAVLAVAGDFRTRSMLETIRGLFKDIPGGVRPSPRIRPEPPQRGEKRVIVEGVEETVHMEIGYHGPNAASPDFFPLAVLDSVLGGASNLNMFGSGIPNKTSRLYQALVSGGIAASVRGQLSATIDPHLYSIEITVRPDRTPEEALAVVDWELDRVLNEKIAADELSKAIKQARALFAYGSESITNQAFWMGYSEMFADYAWFETYLDRLSVVTAEDVLTIAQKYLVASNRIVGVYRPKNGAGHG